MRRSLLAIAIISTASAPARSETPPPLNDPRGPFLSAGVSYGSGVAGAEAALGWNMLASLGGLARAAANLDLDYHVTWTELQLGARVSPLPVAAPWWSLEAHAGRTWVDVPRDCPFSDGSCYGGKGRGYSYGVAVRAAVYRGRRASFDVWLGYDEARWRVANEGTRSGRETLRIGLGFSIH